MRFLVNQFWIKYIVLCLRRGSDVWSLIPAADVQEITLWAVAKVLQLGLES